MALMDFFFFKDLMMKTPKGEKMVQRVPIGMKNRGGLCPLYNGWSISVFQGEFQDGY